MHTNLGVSSELHSLVMSMLAKDPLARPTAEEVNQQIAQLWSVDPTDNDITKEATPRKNAEQQPLDPSQGTLNQVRQ